MNSPKSKMPADYHRKAREAKRQQDIRIARSLGRGFVSRHLEDPEGSQRWVETGVWKDSR